MTLPPPLAVSSANAALAAYQLERHGVDRYPSPVLQYVKLVTEVGELGDALLHESQDVAFGNLANVRDELADVALCLYDLAAKLDIDLDTAIHNVVLNDDRRFTDVTEDE